MPTPFLGSTSGLSRQRLRGQRLQHIGRDLYLLGSRDLTSRDLAVAATLALPGSTPCLQTAAGLLGLPVDDDRLIHVARPRGAAWSRRAGLQVHRLAVRTDELHDLDGLLVTGGPRTFVDLAAHLDDEQLVVVGDVVLRRWGAAAIAQAVQRGPGRPGARRLRTVVPLLDAGSGSPPETRGRLRLHAAGFTRLRHRVVIRDEHGGWLCEPDLADEVARVAWQYDGLVHYLGGPRQWRKDLDRDESARQQHWQVVQSTALDDAQPWRLLAKMEAAYQRSALRWGRQVLPDHLQNLEC